jgi:hypothetical protein
MATKRAESPLWSSLPLISGVFGRNFAKRAISPGTLTSAATPPALLSRPATHGMGRTWVVTAPGGRPHIQATGPVQRQAERGLPPRTGIGPIRPTTRLGGTVADNTYNGYCVKCKEKRDFQGTVEVSKTGMNMAKGKCPVCGTTVNRILGKAKA